MLVRRALHYSTHIVYPPRIFYCSRICSLAGGDLVTGGRGATKSTRLAHGITTDAVEPRLLSAAPSPSPRIFPRLPRGHSADRYRPLGRREAPSLALSSHLASSLHLCHSLQQGIMATIVSADPALQAWVRSVFNELRPGIDTQDFDNWLVDGGRDKVAEIARMLHNRGDPRSVNFLPVKDLSKAVNAFIISVFYLKLSLSKNLGPRSPVRSNFLASHFYLPAE